MYLANSKNPWSWVTLARLRMNEVQKIDKSKIHIEIWELLPASIPEPLKPNKLVIIHQWFNLAVSNFYRGMSVTGACKSQEKLLRYTLQARLGVKIEGFNSCEQEQLRHGEVDEAF